MGGYRIWSLNQHGSKNNLKKDEGNINHRMNYLLGHLKANVKMVEDGKYCIDIICQNQAVISALQKVNELILRNHLNTCVTDAIRGKDERERERVLEEIMGIFKEEGK